MSRKKVVGLLIGAVILITVGVGVGYMIFHSDDQVLASVSAQTPQNLEEQIRQAVVEVLADNDRPGALYRETLRHGGSSFFSFDMAGYVPGKDTDINPFLSWQWTTDRNIDRSRAAIGRRSARILSGTPSQQEPDPGTVQPSAGAAPSQEFTLAELQQMFGDELGQKIYSGDLLTEEEEEVVKSDDAVFRFYLLKFFSRLWDPERAQKALDATWPE